MIIQATSQRKVVRLNQPDLTHTVEYALRFYATVFKSMLGSHRLLLQDSPIYWSAFELSRAEQQRWMDVFGMTDDQPVRFTYANRAATMSLMRIIANQGINFKYLRHLKSEISFTHNATQTGELYTVSTEQCDIMPLRDDRAVLVTKTITCSDVTGIATVQKDYWAVLKLPAYDIQQLKYKRLSEPYDVSQFRDLTKREPVLTESVPGVHVIIPKDMGLQYGKISGDLNPTHISRIAAKLFCNSQPFIQGFCTVNYVIKYLTKLTSRPLHTLQVTLIRPIYTGEQVTMRFSADEFEICNSNQELLAAGKWSVL